MSNVNCGSTSVVMVSERARALRSEKETHRSIFRERGKCTFSHEHEGTISAKGNNTA